MAKHTHDLEGFSMVTRNKTDGVNIRYEGREYVPAVCVKVRGRLRDRMPADVVDAPDAIASAAEEYVKSRWWCETPQSLAVEYLAKAFRGCKVETRQAGRGDGWVAVHGIGTPDDWTTKQLVAWEEFETAIESSLRDAEAAFFDEIRERMAAS